MDTKCYVCDVDIVVDDDIELSEDECFVCGECRDAAVSLSLTRDISPTVH